MTMTISEEEVLLLGTMGPLILPAAATSHHSPKHGGDQSSCPLGSRGSELNLMKPQVTGGGLTKSGKKATAFLLSILKSWGMSMMSPSVRPSSRFSTSQFQSTQL